MYKRQRWSRPLTEVDPFGVRVTLDREHKEVRLETSPALLRAAAEKAVCRLEKTVRQAEEKLLDIDYTCLLYTSAGAARRTTNGTPAQRRQQRGTARRFLIRQHTDEQRYPPLSP